MPITAPYNFVPPSKKVFFPDWADQVSHDIPFEDGISGEIVCELTTQTPVYVRNGVPPAGGEGIGNDRNAFFNVDGQYMIPGTSLKGMLRNVIEIATFGKMCQVDNHRYSVRDLSNKSLYQERFTTQGANWAPKSKPAWLEKVPGTEQWRLIKCFCARVEQKDLRAYHPAKPDIHGCDTAVNKYTAWEPESLEVNFTSTGPMNQNERHAGKRLFYDLVISGSLAPGSQGTIVFTGQPGTRKHMEFVFFNPSGTLSVDDMIQRNFEFVHSVDGNIEKPNDEWAFWKSKLNRGGKVPVFYLEEDAGALHSIGLAQMYKLPYTYGIHKTIENYSIEHFDYNRPDFAELLFGSTKEQQKGRDLKGRISISHALLTNTPAVCALEETVLGAPKPTYYPTYLEQTKISEKKYITYMDEEAKARGWKRYPARLPGAVESPLPVPPSPNVTTKFIPLAAGASFSFRVKMHNLKPAEVGAVIWVLNWGGDSLLCHSLGMGKPFGYGLCKISFNQSASRVRCLSVQSENIFQATLEAFKSSMQKFCTAGTICSNWEKSEPIFHLTNMANPQGAGETEISQKAKLRTMKIKNVQGVNEFYSGKDPGNPQRLEPLSVYDAPSAFPTTEEVWPDAILVWAVNNHQLTASFPGQKNAVAILKSDEEKQLVPKELHKKVFIDRKATKAIVTIERTANTTKIIKIGNK